LNKISIQLSNNYKLIAEQNTGEFDKELFIGIEDETGRYHQDLVIVRPTYKFENNDVVFGSDKFEILVFGEADKEDFTDKYTVPLYKEDEE